jgi:protein-disulfide isomerase
METKLKANASKLQVAASVLLLCVSALTIYLQFYGCRRLGQPKQNQLIAYVRDRFGIPSDARINIVSDRLLSGSCTHVVQLSSSTWQALRSFYVSGDQNYLFPSAFDLRDDIPSRSATETSLALPFAPLADIPAPTRGEKSAPLVLLEFADFECPFCRRFANLMANDLRTSDRNKVKVKFHYFPLPIHPWAERAAEQAYCVSQQSEPTFWDLHDYLFLHQETLRSDTVDAQISAFLLSKQSIDMKKFSACSHSISARRAVAADVALGMKYGVNSTPTIFVNGLRVVGSPSAEDLQKYIDKASLTP